MHNGNDWDDVAVEVVPMLQQNQPYYLVLFETRDDKAKKETRPVVRTRATGPNAARIAKLEEELAATRDYLQSTIQEIEAANQELQAANEEILSSNEELKTVNDELHARNGELARVRPCKSPYNRIDCAVIALLDWNR